MKIVSVGEDRGSSDTQGREMRQGRDGIKRKVDKQGTAVGSWSLVLPGLLGEHMEDASELFHWTVRELGHLLSNFLSLAEAHDLGHPLPTLLACPIGKQTKASTDLSEVQMPAVGVLSMSTSAG